MKAKHRCRAANFMRQVNQLRLVLLLISPPALVEMGHAAFAIYNDLPSRGRSCKLPAKTFGTHQYIPYRASDS